jgi:hypothetical protein
LTVEVDDTSTAIAGPQKRFSHHGSEKEEDVMDIGFYMIVFKMSGSTTHLKPTSRVDMAEKSLVHKTHLNQAHSPTIRAMATEETKLI